MASIPPLVITTSSGVNDHPNSIDLRAISRRKSLEAWGERDVAAAMVGLAPGSRAV